MNIIEAIKAADHNAPFITRQKWQHLTPERYGAPKLLPTDSMDGMIVYSDANGKENPRRRWEPTKEETIPKVKRRPDRFDKMRVLLMGQRELLGMGYEELGAKVGSATGTVYNRLHHPEKMTVEEMCLYARTLEIPADDFRAAIPMY